MRILLFVVGILVGLPGLVFFLQGLRVLPASFMYGNPTWIGIGAVMLVVGVAAIVASFRLGRSRPTS